MKLTPPLSLTDKLLPRTLLTLKSSVPIKITLSVEIPELLATIASESDTVKESPPASCNVVVPISFNKVKLLPAPIVDADCVPKSALDTETEVVPAPKDPLI